VDLGWTWAFKTILEPRFYCIKRGLGILPPLIFPKIALIDLQTLKAQKCQKTHKSAQKRTFTTISRNYKIVLIDLFPLTFRFFKG
jgi:hypothetical protein